MRLLLGKERQPLPYRIRLEPLQKESAAVVLIVFPGHDDFQALAGTVNHTVQRTLCHMDRHTGFLCHQQVQTAEQCAAAGEHNAVIDHVCGKLRGSLFQGALNGFHNSDQRISQCIAKELPSLFPQSA